MYNNKELLPIFYKSLVGKEISEEIMKDDITFPNVTVYFKILEIEGDFDNFFDDFIFIEEKIEDAYNILYCFSCIVNIENDFYVYELNEDLAMNLYKIQKTINIGPNTYERIQDDDKNYDLLVSKKEVFYDLISKGSKYKFKWLFKEEKKSIDFIKI